MLIMISLAFSFHVSAARISLLTSISTTWQKWFCFIFVMYAREKLSITLSAFYLWLLFPPEIETVKLARLVFSKLHEICSNWVKEFPLQPKPHRYYETSIHAIKNMRRKMEDKHVCIPDFNMLFNLEVRRDYVEDNQCICYSWGN